MVLHSIEASVRYVTALRRERQDGSRVRRGFSVLELVIVIAIIVALLAMSLPALRGAHMRSKKTGELSNLRQIGMAWFMYAQSNNDSALPGYLETDVQARWEVSYDYPKILTGNTLVGREIPPEIASPWTWRLMPYLSDAGKTLRQHLEEDEYEFLELIERAREVAVEPAFGYNGYYVGGYWTMTQGQQRRPIFRFANATNREGKRVNVVARSPSSIQHSDQKIVFCSTTLRDPGTYRRGSHDAHGYHLAVPPILGEEPQWQIPRGPESEPNDGAYASLSGDIYGVQALTTVPTPLGRYTGTAVVFYADGHCDVQTPGALADQSLWIMGAERVGDVPANRFTHTNH